MRSHMIAKSKQPQLVKASSPPSPCSAIKSGFEANGESGYGPYGLRKNPKKTWRAGDNMTHHSSAATSVSISNRYGDRLWADAKLSALSSVSDTNQEIEVALGLVMLSRDYGYWGGTKFAAGSSDTNSLILEDKSSSVDDEDRRSDSGYFMKCAEDDGSEMRSFC